jgi:hypothetical protein
LEALQDLLGWDSRVGVGTSLAIEGDWLVVGSNQANGTSPKQGRAYVHRRYPLAWIYTTALSSPALADGARFGEDVAISGARILVGAPGLQIATGAAFLFELIGGSWTESAKLMASDVAAPSTRATSTSSRAA